MEEQNPPFNEQRKHPRTSGALVEYYIEGMDAEKKKAFIKDISLDGICIYITEPMADNAIFCMDIYLFGDDTPIKAKGRIVWQSI